MLCNPSVIRLIPGPCHGKGERIGILVANTLNLGMISSQSLGGKPPDTGDRSSNKDRDSGYRSGPSSGANQSSMGLSSVSRADTRDFRVSRHDARDTGVSGGLPVWRRNSRPQDTFRRDDRVSKDHWKERRKFPSGPRKELFRENVRDTFRDSRDLRLSKDLRDSRELRDSRDFGDESRARRDFEDPAKGLRYEERSPIDRAKTDRSITERFSDRRDDRRRPSFPRVDIRLTRTESSKTENEFKGPKKFLKRPGDKFKDLFNGNQKSSISQTSKDTTPSGTPSDRAVSSSGDSTPNGADVANNLKLSRNQGVNNQAKISRTSMNGSEDVKVTSGSPPTSTSQVLSDTAENKRTQSKLDIKANDDVKRIEIESDTYVPKHTSAPENSEREEVASENLKTNSTGFPAVKVVIEGPQISSSENKLAEVDNSTRGQDLGTDVRVDTDKPVDEMKHTAFSTDTDISSSTKATKVAERDLSTKAAIENPVETFDPVTTSSNSLGEVAPTLEDQSFMDVDTPKIKRSMLPQELKIHNTLIASIAEMEKHAPVGSWKPKVWQANDLSQTTIGLVRLHKQESEKAIEKRRAYFEEKYKNWISITENMDREAEILERRKEDGKVSSEMAQPPSSNGNVRKKNREDPQAAPTSNGQSQSNAVRNQRRSRDRHSRAHGDVARSEAEFLEILANLEAQTARDPLVRARLTSAKIPTQSQVDGENKFYSTNELVVDHSLLLKRLRTDAIDDFTNDEHTRFTEAFLKYPKEFGKIAEEVGRNFNECVAHYYRTKKVAGYKKILLQKSKRKRGRKPRKKPEETDIISAPVTPRMVQDEVATMETPPSPGKVETVFPEQFTGQISPPLEPVHVQQKLETLPQPVQPIQQINALAEVAVLQENNENWSPKDTAYFSKLLATYGLQFDKIALGMGKGVQEVRLYFEKHQNDHSSLDLYPQLSNTLGVNGNGSTASAKDPPTGVFMPREGIPVIPPVVKPSISVEANTPHYDGMHFNGSENSPASQGINNLAVDPDETTIDHIESFFPISPLPLPKQQIPRIHHNSAIPDLKSDIRNIATTTPVVPFYLPPVSLSAPIRPILPIKPKSHHDLLVGHEGSPGRYSFETSGFNISNERRN